MKALSSTLENFTLQPALLAQISTTKNILLVSIIHLGTAKLYICMAMNIWDKSTLLMAA